MDATKRKHQRELDAALDDCKNIAIDKDKTIKVVLMQNFLVIFHVFANLTRLDSYLNPSQNLRDICKSNTAVAVQLRTELSRSQAEQSQLLFDQEVKHRNDLKTVRGINATKQETLKESMKVLQQELCDVTDMSMQVADEFNQLKNTTDAQLRQSTKRADCSEYLSKVRLEKLKKLKDNETQLRESLDCTNETFEVQLAKAHAEIGVLTEMLADSSSEVEMLQDSLVKVREELDVSFAFSFSYIFPCTHSILNVTTETKTSCYTEEEGSVGRSSDAIGG